MRGIGWFAAMVFTLACASPLFAADDAKSLAPIPPTATSPAPDVFPPPLIHGPQTTQPPTVEPSEPPTGYIAPPPSVPAAPIQSGFFVVEGTSRTEFDEQGKPLRTVATGPVTVRYSNIVVTASEGADVDYKTNLATFGGNVVIETDGQRATMRSLTLNMKTREWTGGGAVTTIEPRFAKGYLRAPVFAEGQSIQGKGRREIDVFNGDSTTCNLTHPHYHFTAKSVVVYPDDKIILRNATMYALGAKLFTVPRFVIPIKQLERNPNLIPRTGQTLEEGYFLKTSYSYLGTRTQTGFVDLDVMTRKGIGEGARNYWKNDKAEGQAQFYHVFDNNIKQNTYTGRLTHTQLFGTVKVNVTSDFRSNSYLYAPQSRTLVNQMILTRDRIGANTSLTLSDSINNYVTRSTNLAATLKHHQLFGEPNKLDTSFDYIAFSGDQPTRARLTSKGLFERDAGKFDWHISAQKFTDLSDEAFVGKSGFGGIESLPEVGIATDSKRLHRTLFGLPANLKFTYGQYTELPSGTEAGRTFFSLDTPVRKYKFSDTWTFGAGGGFKQYAYSDNTAQYSCDASAQLSKKLGPTSALNFTYRYQRPNGFTPFRSDFVGKYNVVNAGIDLKDSRKFRVGVLTGYNFLQTGFPWQDVVLRMSVEPTPSFLFYTATSYDVNNSKWRTLINQFRFRSGQNFKLDIGTRYDPLTRKLATARVLLNTPLGNKTKLEGLAGYNGFTNKFDYRGIALTRDLHCWEASIAYIDQGGFYSNKGFTLNLRIKAFPIFREFGLGAFGQTLDTSVGQVY